MIKKFTLIVLSLLLIAFISCKKDPASSSNPGGTSTYSFDTGGGNCPAPVVAGIYSAGVAMNASNTLSITVNVVVKGTYSIRTTSANGVYFVAGGTFTTTGLQTVVFVGNGTPVKAGNFTYVPATNNTCSFNVTFLNGAPSAVFTYTGAPGTCTAPVISGTYGSGVALGSGNYVDLAVTVTTPGAYTISTNSANGISFSGSGSFTAAGAQVVRLIGSGTPSAQGGFAYTPSNNGCSFTINVTTAGGTSVYTLSGAPGACTTPVIAGTYTAGVPLGAGNTVTVKADVTTAGTYSLSTTTANGMTFSGSGLLAVGIAQPIVLTGTGTPAAANTSTFTVGPNGCTFPITAVAPPPAVYTLTGAPGACNPITVNGSYFTGSPLSASSNTAVVQANVTTPGAYTITTSTVNGMTFSKTGVFAGTGTQSVTLSGSGTPAAVGTNTFTAGTGGCTFPVTVTVPTSPCTGLVDGTFVMTGQFTLNGFSFGVSFNGQYQVTIQQTPVQIDVFFPGINPPSPGIYSIGIVSMHCLAANFTDWNATSGLVYVSHDLSGNTVVEFCNVNFTGHSLTTGGTATSTGAGKMVF